MNHNKKTKTQLVEEILALQNEVQIQKDRLQSTMPQSSLIASATDAIILLDEKQEIVQFNNTAEQVFGYKEADVMGKSIYFLFANRPFINQQPNIQNIGESALKSHTIHPSEMHNGLRADGEVFPIQASISQTTVNNRNYYMIILRDVDKDENLEKLIMRQYDSLNTLHLITLDLLNRRDIQDLLQFIVDQAVTLLDVSYCEIVLPDSDMLVAQAFTHNGPFMENNRFTRNEAQLSWQVFETGLPVILDDYSSWPDRHGIYDDEGFHATAVLPLLVENKCIGVLGLTRNKANYKFSEEHILTATRLADIAALAIENSRLYIEIKKLATTDGLTGTNNRRNLMEIGEREIERAIRYNRPLSILMLDVDHFKKINDTWGHPTGDVVLRGIADECMRQIRTSDMIGRYGELSNDSENTIGRFGGEEFGILLPETSHEGALVIAERIRSSIEQMTFQSLDHSDGYGQHKDINADIHATVSIGVSCLLSKMDQLEELFARADHALYAAKESGRNCVCTAAHSEQSIRLPA